MSHKWEWTMGLDPWDATDGAEDLDRDGYSNLEEHLHQLLH